MHPLIFVPRGTGPNAATLADAGLADFAEGSTPLDVGKGPDGREGTLYGWMRPTDACRDFGYFPERQEWVESSPAGRYWLGLWKDKPPTPTELRRPRLLHGRAVELGDGNSWVVPDVRKLPATVKRLDADGNPVFTLKGKFAAYASEVRVWAAVLGEANADSAVVEIDGEIWHFAARTLRMNYRVTPELLAELEVLGPDDVLRLVVAATGLMEGR